MFLNQLSGQPQVAVAELVGHPLMLVAVEPDALAFAHKQVKGRRQVGQRTFTIPEIPWAFSLVSWVASCSLS
jgi:hypothetical protein